MEPIRPPRVLDATPHRKVELLLVLFTRSGTEVDPTLLNETTSSTFSKRANGKVAGRDGAAAKLGMKRTTFSIMLTAYGTFRESQYCAPLESGAAWW
jgi:hypothetical protein